MKLVAVSLSLFGAFLLGLGEVVAGIVVVALSVYFHLEAK